MLKALTVVLLLIATNINAMNVYKCKVGNEVVFSQMPCNTDSPHNEKILYSDTKHTVATSTETSERVNKNSLSIVSTESYLLTQKKKRVQSRIQRLLQQEKEEFNTIKTKYDIHEREARVAGHLVSVIAGEYASTRKKYQKLLERERKALKNLEKKLVQQG